MKRLICIVLAVLVTTALPLTALATGPDAASSAEFLYELGLLRGVGTKNDGTPDFALERQPTRCEAVTMLIRLLGKEQEALEGSWNMPFVDVPDWAEPYIGYAWEHGLTFGNSTTELTFGGKVTDYVTSSQYLTFVLRALGYQSGVDFAWDRAYQFSDCIGLTDGRYDPDLQESFLRSDLAYISYCALDTMKKGSSGTLGEQLVAEGVITQEAYEKLTGFTGDLSEETVYRKLMSLQENYPEGMPWTEENSYRHYGMLGYYHYTGYGCVSFAMIMSDAAFGRLPYRQKDAGLFEYDQLRPGDILRVEQDTHTVVILEVLGDKLVIAEGNYNGMVHWGRVLPRKTAEESTYLWTRYPEDNDL